MINRRHFLQSFAATVVGGYVGINPAIANELHWKDWKVNFDKALKQNPWLLGYQGISRSNFPKVPLSLVYGTLPKQLQGVFYRNGPARHEINDMRYHHWFDGDGLVHAFRFDGQQVTHQGRFVETEKYVSETQQEMPLEQGFGTALPFMNPVARPDDVNVANINIIVHNQELLALWEGGSAYQLAPENLKTIGIKSWNPKTQGAPFSAHPRLDRDGTLWNFGYASSAKGLIIYRIAPDSSLRDMAVHQLPFGSMIHDFIITEHHLVFILPPFIFEQSKGSSFLDSFTWKPENGNIAMIVDKNNLSQKTMIAFPAFWIFHFENAYEENSQIIHFKAPIYHDPSIMTASFRNIMRGEVSVESEKGGVYASGVIDLNKKKVLLEKSTSMLNTEFPRIHPKYQGHKNRYVLIMQTSKKINTLYFDRVVFLDHDTGKASTFSYPENTMADEHVFVPNTESDKEGKGWIIGTTLNYQKARTSLNIFDAEHIEEGPIAILEMDYAIPLGLHGNFVSR